MSPPPKISRRTMTLGGIAAGAAAIIAGAVYEIPKLFKHRARGHYADLVNRLDDPEQAAIVGRAFRATNFLGDVVPTFEDLAAADLKKRLARNTLPELMAQDSAGKQPMTEADGWVLPAVLAELCVLAYESI